VWLWVVAAPAAAAGGTGDDVRRFIQAAAKLYESLDYDQALEQLAHAKALGPRADEGVEISLYEGIIYADMSGHRDQSQAAFRAALLLRPDARLPVKVSPKVERDFEQLRKQVSQELARTRRTTRTPPPPAGDRPVATPPPEPRSAVPPPRRRTIRPTPICGDRSPMPSTPASIGWR